MKAPLKCALPALLVLALLTGCKKAAPAGAEIKDHGSDRDSVVEAVKSGQLQPSAAGVIILPESSKAASATGQVFVGKDAGGGLLVLFPVMQSSGRMECLLYAEKSPGNAPTTVEIGGMTVNLSGRSQGNWHQASVGNRHR